MTEPLPQDPYNGQEVEVPEDLCWGSTTRIQLWSRIDSTNDIELIGHCENIERCATSSKYWTIKRAKTVLPLKPHSIVNVVAHEFDFASMVFIDGLGWVGARHRQPGKLLINKYLRVRINFVLDEGTGDTWYYELVGLETIPHIEENAQ